MKEETKYFKRELTDGSVFYIAQNNQNMITIYVFNEEYMISNMKYNPSKYSDYISYIPISRKEFIGIYNEATTEQRLIQLSLIGQEENEFIRNVCIASDQYDGL